MTYAHPIVTKSLDRSPDRQQWRDCVLRLAVGPDQYPADQEDHADAKEVSVAARLDEHRQDGTNCREACGGTDGIVPVRAGDIRDKPDRAEREQGDAHADQRAVNALAEHDAVIVSLVAWFPDELRARASSLSFMRS